MPALSRLRTDEAQHLAAAVAALCTVVELLVVDRRKALGRDGAQALERIDAVRRCLERVETDDTSRDAS